MHKSSPEIRDKSKRKDKSGKKDEPTEQEETEDKSDTPPIEFEDQMYELKQETEMMTEYQEMTRTGGRTCFAINTKGES